MADIKLKPTDWDINASKYGIKPGDKVILLGPQRAEIQFTNCKDITVMAESELLIKGVVPGHRAVIFSNCQGIKFTGSNGPIEITGASGHGFDFRELSTDFEADNIYMHDLAYSGFEAKTNPTCDPRTWRYDPVTNKVGFVMKNVWLHHLRVVRMKGGEGGYSGQSHHHTTVSVPCNGKQVAVKEHDIEGLVIEDNIFEDIGRDAIQAGSATRGCIIRRNKIKNFGMTKEYGQGSGITVNPGTVAEVYDNIIDTGSGFGIIAQGPGGSKIHHNVIINTGTAKDGGGIMLASYGQNIGAYDVRNNTLLDINRVGIEYYSGVNLSDNIINVKTGGQLIKIGASAKITDQGNMKFLGDRSFLKLDENYIPTAESSVVPGVGIGDYVKPPVVITKESAEIEIVTTGGVDEVYAVGVSGKRIKLK